MSRTAQVRIANGARLNVSVADSDTGRQFLDTVCKAIPVREYWFFGFQYFDKKDRPRFLSVSKLVRSCPAGRYGQPFSFRLRAIYYPPNLRDLNEMITVELFYNEVKEQVLKEYITCSQELYVPLAALAVQADHQGKVPENYQVMPDRVKQRYYITDNLQVKVAALLTQMPARSKEDAMREYLNVVQTLPMFGTHYFWMKDRVGNDAHVWLAINSDGISVCDKLDKSIIAVTYRWPGIRKCHYRYKKFIIEFMDEDVDDVVFSTSYFSTCKQMKWLCNNYKEFFRSVWDEPDSIVQLIRQQVEDEAKKRRES